jgi:hypothetical protein
MAAEGMRYLPQTAKLTKLNTILAAAASTARPLHPFVEEDPLHFAHGRLAMLLFYGGNAYGPKGVIWNNLAGVDRNLLYPAIRAVAANPVGQARSCLYHAYNCNSPPPTSTRWPARWSNPSASAPRPTRCSAAGSAAAASRLSKNSTSPRACRSA